MTEETIKLNIKNGAINTYSGKIINLLEPTVDMIDIEDIARGLAYKGHFGGQTPFYFSIAQHSILVYYLMVEGHEDRDLHLLGLLHDASEAYIGDMVKPLKVNLPEFCIVEDRLTEVIFEKFGLDSKQLPHVKPYDKIAQELEFETFFEGAERVGTLSPNEGRDAFMKAFIHLTT